MSNITHFLKRMTRSKPTVFGGILLLILGLISFIGPALTPYSSTTFSGPILNPPSASHWFGTDDFGRDVLTRTLWGLRVSFLIGLTTSLISSIAGVLIGMVAGFLDNWDYGLMRVMDVIMSFPSLLLAMAIMITLGNAPANIVLALALVYTPRTARIVRSSTLSVSEEEYIEATQAMGFSTWRTLSRHVLPNIFPSLAVQATFVFAYAVLGEAGLSFIGVGIQPPTPSLGNIIDARSIIREGPWMTFLPGGMIFLLVMSINLLGDGMREVLDPKRKLLGGK